MNNVFVGLSGGVDSSVSASLLKKDGYDVTGVFIKIWQPEFIECTWEQDRLDAMRVAAHLQIPFREIDLSSEYKQHVIDTMISAYQRGVTPNPDVLCNEFIKFGTFYKWSREHGADIVATGHYARTRTNTDGTTDLLRGVDTKKDQSYFVHRIHGDDLAHIRFPIGHLEKHEVRSLAQELELPVAHKPDSQGLCFVGHVSIRDFLRQYITIEPGVVLDTHGNTIGTHEGASLYTIGQRHGFLAPSEVPLYVLDTNVQDNTITVGPSTLEVARTSCEFDDAVWFNDTPISGHTYSMQARYREHPVLGTIAHQEGIYVVQVETPHIFTRGQSIVIYDGDVCIGGGVIR